jgi:hypothetical protein
MATDDSPQTHTAPTYHAISLDSGIRISTTGGIETTKTYGKNFPQKSMIKREGLLIELDEKEKRFFHGIGTSSSYPTLLFLMCQ